MIVKAGGLFLQFAQTGTAHHYGGHFKGLGDAQIPPNTDRGRVAPIIGCFNLRVGQKRSNVRCSLLRLRPLTGGEEHWIVGFHVFQYLSIMGLSTEKVGQSPCNQQQYYNYLLHF